MGMRVTDACASGSAGRRAGGCVGKRPVEVDRRVDMRLCRQASEWRGERIGGEG